MVKFFDLITILIREIIEQVMKGCLPLCKTVASSTAILVSIMTHEYIWDYETAKTITGMLFHCITMLSKEGD